LESLDRPEGADTVLDSAESQVVQPVICDLGGTPKFDFDNPSRFRKVLAHEVGAREAKMVKAGRGKKGKKGGAMRSLETRLVMSPKYPPTFDANPTYQCTRRFHSSGTVAIVSLGITLGSLHRQFSVVTVASTTAVCFVDCWRIRKVSIWALNADVDKTTTVSVYPVGIDSSDNMFADREQVYVCSSRSEAEPGHMAIVPARDMPMGAWHRTTTVNTSGNLFVINVDTAAASSGHYGTVTMDIEFDFVLNLFGAPQGYSPATTSATLGTMGGQNITSGGSPAFIVDAVNSLG